MSRLVVFDIDGTVCDTNDVDDRCYVKAVAESFELASDEVDWSAAPHITDAAILEWLLSKHLDRDPTPFEIARCQSRFVDLLQLECNQRPECFRAILGAPEIFALLSNAGWDVSFATGGWRASAEFKLRRIGVAPKDFVLVTADDAKTRPDIVRLAIREAARRYARSYTRVVSVGDGVWDVATAATLGLPFVGVGSRERAESLCRSGAETVISDFSDPGMFMRALEGAAVPVV